MGKHVFVKIFKRNHWILFRFFTLHLDGIMVMTSDKEIQKWVENNL